MIYLKQYIIYYMKTKIYLFAFICICLTSFGLTRVNAAIVITGPSTAVSGEDIIFTAQGETATSYINSIELNYGQSTIPAGMIPNEPVVVNYFQNGSKVFTCKTQAFLPNGATGSATITFAFNVYVQGVTGPTLLKKQVTITPPPPPPVAIKIVVANSPVVSGGQLFFTALNENSTYRISSLSINTAKSSIPWYITMSDIVITGGWSPNTPATYFYTKGTFVANSVSPNSATFNLAIDIKLTGSTSTQTVPVTITVKKPDPPVTGNTITLQGGSNYIQYTVTGTEASAGTFTPSYQWQISTDGGTTYNPVAYNPGSPTGLEDVDQLSNTSITHSASLLPINNLSPTGFAVNIRRMASVGSSVSYSNVITITKPINNSTPNITDSPADDGTPLPPGTPITYTIQNPQPGVTYYWYSVTQGLGGPHFPPFDTSAILDGTGPSIQIKTPVKVRVYGSDGSFYGVISR